MLGEESAYVGPNLPYSHFLAAFLGNQQWFGRERDMMDHCSSSRVLTGRPLGWNQIMTESNVLSNPLSHHKSISGKEVIILPKSIHCNSRKDKTLMNQVLLITPPKGSQSLGSSLTPQSQEVVLRVV